MKIDLVKELGKVMQSGKYYLGTKEVKKHFNDLKLIIVANNAPEKFEHKIVYNYNGSATELASLCKRAHPISVIGIEEPGKSNILMLLKSK